MAAGVDLLIEKPLAASLEDADEIAGLARRLGCVVQVGHLERFNPAVRAVRELLNRPMFFEVHRLSVFTPRSLDVDVVLDLMIHDLDIVLKLVGQPVREVRAVGLPVLSKKVDIANVRLEFENGCVANFTASRVSTERVQEDAVLPAAPVSVAGLCAAGLVDDRCDGGGGDGYGATGERWRQRPECAGSGEPSFAGDVAEQGAGGAGRAAAAGD